MAREDDLPTEALRLLLHARWPATFQDLRTNGLAGLDDLNKISDAVKRPRKLVKADYTNLLIDQLSGKQLRIVQSFLHYPNDFDDFDLVKALEHLANVPLKSRQHIWPSAGVYLLSRIERMYKQLLNDRSCSVGKRNLLHQALQEIATYKDGNALIRLSQLAHNVSCFISMAERRATWYDLPQELHRQVVGYLAEQYEISTQPSLHGVSSYIDLHSCALTNRELYNISSPIIWGQLLLDSGQSNERLLCLLHLAPRIGHHVRNFDIACSPTFPFRNSLDDDFDLDKVEEDRALACRALLCHLPNLTQLDIEYNSDLFETAFQGLMASKQRMSKIKSLRIRAQSRDNMQQFGILAKFISACTLLDELQLNFQSVPRDDYIDAEDQLDLCAVVSHLQYLTSLDIKQDTPYIRWPSQLPHIISTSITELALSYCHGLKAEDFFNLINAFPHLTNLIVCNTPCDLADFPVRSAIHDQSRNSIHTLSLFGRLTNLADDLQFFSYLKPRVLSVQGGYTYQRSCCSDLLHYIPLYYRSLEVLKLNRAGILDEAFPSKIQDAFEGPLDCFFWQDKYDANLPKE